MKAAVLKAPKDLRVEDVPLPSMAPEDVLVGVRACGICGSDLRYFLGENPWALHTLGKELPNPPNIILGHEFAGEVLEVGKDAPKELLGKRVVVSPYRACGMCRFCRVGRYNLCPNTIHLGHGAGWGEREYYPGGMAELCPVWADKAFPLPESVSYEEAALLDIVGIAVHGLDISGMRPGANAVVLGIGPLGLSFVQIARIWGGKRIFCTDVYSKTLELALETGADDAIDVRKEDPVDRIMSATAGLGADVVFDTVGSAETLGQGLKMLAPAGTLVNMATHATEISLNLLQIGSERVIRSSSNYYFHDFQAALDLAADGRLNLKPLITHRFPLEEVPKAFEILLDREKNHALKVMIL